MYELALVSDTTASTLDGREIRWDESIRYLDVHITSAKAMLRNPSTAPLMQCLEKLLALLLKSFLLLFKWSDSEHTITQIFKY